MKIEMDDGKKEVELEFTPVLMHFLPHHGLSEFSFYLNPENANEKNQLLLYHCEPKMNFIFIECSSLKVMTFI